MPLLMFLKEKAIKQMEKAEEKRKAKKAPKEELPPHLFLCGFKFGLHQTPGQTLPRNFYVNNDANAQRKIYRICLRELEELIDHSSVDMGQLITTLHSSQEQALKTGISSGMHLCGKISILI